MADPQGPEHAFEAPLTPCIGLCQIAENGRCKGCQRTLEEIALWSSLSNPERAAIMAELESRH